MSCLRRDGKLGFRACTRTSARNPGHMFPHAVNSLRQPHNGSGGGCGMGCLCADNQATEVSRVGRALRRYEGAALTAKKQNNN